MEEDCAMNIYFKILMLIVCLLNSVANALEFKPFVYQNRQILLLIGEFVQNDFTQFYNISQKLYPIHEIWLHSPGGNLQESLQIGRRIRELRITTIVPSNAECDSACTFAFVIVQLPYISHGWNSRQGGERSTNTRGPDNLREILPRGSLA